MVKKTFIITLEANEKVLASIDEASMHDAVKIGLTHYGVKVDVRKV